MSLSLRRLLCAAGLLPLSLAQITVRSEPESAAEATVDSLDFSDAAGVQLATLKGINFGCKCYPGERCWPSANKWNALNNTVDGRLLVHIPPGAPCHNTFNGLLGMVSTYDANKCAEVTQNFENESWTVSQPAAALWTYFTNDTCRPTQNPTDSCTLGYYGVYVIMASTPRHVKAGIDFARRNNLRLIVRNTGHDFIGRSTGYGSLIINTNSFQQIDWIDSYSGPGAYKGGAVTIGAGVQGETILSKGHARDPPLVVVTGECPTVGIAGGFIQGGGHGPWTTLKGFSADNVLAFEAITASGHYVTANERQNADLFWALKGGGPASFAVILSVTMKTFPDIPSAGATLYINSTHTLDSDVWWNGTTAFHKWSNHFVDNGLYVYFEIMPLTFRARPFVGIGKSKAELQSIVQPLLDELTAKGLPFDFDIKDFPTFYDLYVDLFEPEAAGGSALTGGWMFNHEDVATNNDGIIEAFKTVLSPGPDLFGFMIGHLFNPGYGAPKSNSATHPSWRNATNFIIAALPVAVGSSLAQKAELQNVLTNTIDEALRQASTSGCTYVNEADPYQRDWQSHFWGAEYPKLKALRWKWDPHGVFYAVSTPGTEGWEVIEDGTRHTVPAIPNGGQAAPAGKDEPESWLRRLAIPLRNYLKVDVENRILFAGFLITLSFSFTQVPIFYVFHLMECEVFYKHHPPYEGSGDRCSRNEIAAGTATQFSILGMSTTFCGTINLFVAGWMAKRFGPRAALMVQTLVPAIRVATQILGVLAGGEAGIIIIQCTQLITIIGGPVGYILVANIIAGELVAPLRRTAVFGMLQGCIMLGQGLGYLAGGMIGDVWGISRPFEVAFYAFLLSSVYVRVAVPYIAAESLSSGSKTKSKGFAELLSPLRVLVPQKVLLETGVSMNHYGVLFLCAGVFLGVLATGYAPLLIQMYATAVFEFQQADNGWLMSGFAFMRAAFLIFLFPRIISGGRKWYMARERKRDGEGPKPRQSSRLATNPEELEAPVGSLAEEEPVSSGEAEDGEGTAFDLFFLRISLVVDGVLTMCAAFATKSWHIYLGPSCLFAPLRLGLSTSSQGRHDRNVFGFNESRCLERSDTRREHRQTRNSRPLRLRLCGLGTNW
ncbi:hypothetical protein CHGG_10697 [Chaetomium globosum CBS 148.51]|uniref:FAD-binding PCMH-type domain-containing protein n=1 Tax=Chaetomium globosum (strain ATCC 6205 / CBS 148.51 / DSM 1962 / NBRC 6347 / NRRL 1970) TaxID=306901 RepID=Q2GMV7_CHAGB|nr:uncharacterized protein CHGG_10697 [Chaetomium globosum CBS 148.51]EAQ84293.1 hypothetical protein CHGG_10697 [Chaetomium globosum CBS 148.51]